MAIATLSDYVFDDLGSPVGGIRVRAYALLEDGSVGAIHVQEAFTSSTSGRWELINLDFDTSPTGIFAIEITNQSTGQTRWRMGDIRLQVGYLTGPDGNVPINDQAIVEAKIADGAVSDVKIGNRTINADTTAPAANTGPLTTMLSLVGKQIKALMGTATWNATPPTTLQAARDHILNTANPHTVTAQQASAVENMSTTRRVYSGTEGNITSVSGSTIGDLYITTDSSRTIYRKSGSSTWSILATANYNNLYNVPTNVVAPDSDRLGGIISGLYPHLNTNNHALTAGSSLSTSNFQIQCGSVLVNTNSSGQGTLYPPLKIYGGFVTILLTNGDRDRSDTDFRLDDYVYGSAQTYITFNIGASASRTVRVNYMIVHF